MIGIGFSYNEEKDPPIMEQDRSLTGSSHDEDPVSGRILF